MGGKMRGRISGCETDDMFCHGWSKKRGNQRERREWFFNQPGSPFRGVGGHPKR